MIQKLINSKSLKANITANLTGNIFIALVSIVCVPIYLKYIGAEGYALIGIFSSMQVFLSILDGGLATTINKEISRLIVLPNTKQRVNNLVKTLGSVYWVISIIIGIVAICASLFLAKYWVNSKLLTTETITYSFLLLSLSLIFQFPSSFYSGGLIGLHRQVPLNLLKIFFSILRSFGAIIVLIFTSNSLLAFFTWTLLINILQALSLKYMIWYFLPHSETKGTFDTKELVEVRKFSIGIFGISLTSILLTQIDKIILSKILSLEQFGYYSISCTIGLMIYQIITPLAQSYFPKFSNLISLNKIEDLKNTYHQACQLMSLFIFPATLILMFFSKELIFIWTKNIVITENTWLVTSIYAFGTGVNGLMNIPYFLTISYGWTKLGLYQNILLLMIMTPLTIYLSLKYGVLGGAISWAIVNSLTFFVVPYVIHDKFLKGEAFNWYVKDIAVPMFISIVIIFFGRQFLFATIYSRWVELSLIILLGIISVLGVLPFLTSLRGNIFKLIKVKW